MLAVIGRQNPKNYCYNKGQTVFSHKQYIFKILEFIVNETTR